VRQIKIVQIVFVDMPPAWPLRVISPGNAGVGLSAPILANGVQLIATFIADHFFIGVVELGHLILLMVCEPVVKRFSLVKVKAGENF
jgi:hypothetical protein